MIKYSRVIVEPEEEPVTLDEAKARLRITNEDDDSIITALIKVSRRLCENYAGLSFMPQTRVMKINSFPYGLNGFEIPYGPILSIEGEDEAETPNQLGLTYTDENGDTQLLVLDTDFSLDSHSGIPRLSPVEDWPTDLSDTSHAVTVTYVAGYADADAVPAEAKQAILFQVAHMYERPEGGDQGICYASMDLLDSIKVYWNANQN